MTPSYRAIAKILKSELSPYRFLHSLAVSRLAADLARRHGWDPEKARMAGLVHDCVKEWSPSRLLARVRKRRLKIPDLKFILENSPGLMHAYVGADFARAQGWIDAEQARAVAAHTLGSEKMTVPEMIVFIADQASTDRRFRHAMNTRRIARQNLRAGFREAMAVKIGYQLRKGKKIHPLPVRVWNRLLEKTRD